jgi:hypothetical protein
VRPIPGTAHRGQSTASASARTILEEVRTFPPYDFVFPGLFTIRVSTLVGGNLYSVHDSFFAGRSALHVVCDP